MASKSSFTQGSFDFDLPSDDYKKRILVNDTALAWVRVVKDMPYFVTDNGDPWTPVGQNDGITWPELAGAFRRKDMAAVETYFSRLSDHGINCLRLMLEYCQGENRYIEKPAGYFQPNMISLWDDIFSLCEKYRLRIFLTPYDTFWMWRRWSHHPYNSINNGPCVKRSRWLLCSGMRELIKQRLYFVTRRWGSSGALFAWDLWNEIRPSHGGNSAKGFSEFINDIGGFLRSTEIELYGRAHPQTVSVFSPVLQNDRGIAETIFHHKALDFATIHMYQLKSIDNPRNTIDAALATGRLTRWAINEIKDNRPFFDSEHGPIRAFNGHGRTLRADFDDEYFRHMQWAHFASGGAGGGMRWPYRHPHTLTEGMRTAQLALSRFLPLISWNEFHRININNEIELSDANITAFGCADNKQAVIWLLRTNAVAKNKLLKRNVTAGSFYATIPLLQPGYYRITLWDTVSGLEIESYALNNIGRMRIHLPGVVADMAMAVRYLAA